MDRFVVSRSHSEAYHSDRRPALWLSTMLICCSLTAPAQKITQRGDMSAPQVKIGSVRDVFLGGESKQVGGLPMTLGKAAVPFGGGRVVSLLAHKKYDTLSLEYVDADGGIHGAIFQLTKGQGELVKNELIAQGATISSRQDKATKENAAEARHENK